METPARQSQSVRQAPSSAVEPAREFAQTLADKGLRAALRFLNARTRHRFTGVYRFDAPMLRIVCVYDRENPTLNFGGDNPMTETYCSILEETRKPFGLEDSATDPKVAAHPARNRVISYCGVPVLSADGTPVGSLCHFDLRPRIVPASEIPFMEAVAPLLLETVSLDTRRD